MREDRKKLELNRENDMEDNVKSNRVGGDGPNWIRRFVGRIFPSWKEEKRAPITIHYQKPKPMPDTKEATLITQTSLDGRKRYLIDEGDEFLYEVDENRLHYT
jgi:hypothetical protein